MRISDWSSDVCSSDLRKKRTTNTLAAIRRPVSLSEWGAAKESRAECQAIRRLLRRVEGGGRPLRRQRRTVRSAAVAYGTSGGLWERAISTLARSDHSGKRNLTRPAPPRGRGGGRRRRRGCRGGRR